MIYIDKPKFISVAEYSKAIDNMVYKLKQEPDIVSIYQIGSISDPGISDIDMVAVFKDLDKCDLNPRENLSKKHRYLFAHNLFGHCESDFRKAMDFSCFHNFNLLFGNEQDLIAKNLNPAERIQIKTQIALEYLLKCYMGLYQQVKIGIIKLRSLLLELKALRFDLEILGIDDKTLNSTLSELLSLRSNWFKKKPGKRELDDFFRNFLINLESVLIKISEKKKLMVFNEEKVFLRNSLGFKKGDIWIWDYSVTKLARSPVYIGGKRYFNLMTKKSSFILTSPLLSSIMDSSVKEKRAWESSSMIYNKNRLKHFLPLHSPLAKVLQK